SRIFHAFRRRNIPIPYPIQVELQRTEEPAGSPIDRRQMIGAFRATSIFSTLSDEQLEELADASRALMFGAGEAIVREGDQGGSMFVVCGGRAQVGVAGGANAVAEFGAGDHFGEMSLLTGERRTATVTAVGDSRLIEIAADDFRRIVRHDPTIVDRVTEIMI